MTIQRALCTLTLVTIAILIACRFLDHPIADLVASKEVMRLLERILGGVPRLTLLALLVTILLGASFCLKTPWSVRLRSMAQCLLAITAAYVLTSILLKPIFGRTGPMLWHRQQTDRFLWFSPFGGEYFFPSGHSAILMAWAVTMGAHCGNKRSPLLFATIGCMALVFLNLHYLSDVIAGGFVGAIVAVALIRLLPISAPANRHDSSVRNM